jgi:hypothetical protein
MRGRRIRFYSLSRVRGGHKSEIYGSILEAKRDHPEVELNFFRKLLRRMPSEPLPDLPPAGESIDSVDAGGTVTDPKPGTAPIELSEFSQRLASFGLGEVPDPLLTEARPPSQRRSRP